MTLPRTKSGWVIEAGPKTMPVYFCNAVGDSIQGQRWTINIFEAHFWRSESAARAAYEEWCFSGDNVRVAEHTIHIPTP